VGCGRADAIDYDRKIVLELKPNNPRAGRRGQRQVERYVNELNRTRGGGWIGGVVFY